MSVSKVVVKSVTGQAILPWLDDLARLRIQVFREYPYLYDGALEYEQGYLSAYAASPQSLFVLALADDRVVGAATALPLPDAEAAFRKPFMAQGMAPEQVLYFGESVLDAAWRGQGLGHAFFDEREAHARELGLPVTAFCAVIRPAEHPLRPPGYRPLDGFWRKRGYAPEEGMLAQYRWQDLGEQDETEKAMQFWLRRTA